MEILAIICATAGLFMLIYFAYMFVIAVLQAIIGICLGYRITSFSFAGFMIRNDSGKISFTTTPSRLTAQTQLYIKETTGKLKTLFETILYVFMSVISFFAVIFLRKLSEGNQYMQFTGWLVIVIWFVHTLVYFSLLKNVFSKGYGHYLWEQELITFNKLKNGVRPRDINLIDVDFNLKNQYAQRCILFNYYILLDSKKYEMLYPYIQKFEKNIGNVQNIIASDVPYAYEIVYYYSVVDENQTKAEHYVDLLGNLLINDNDINGKRVYAAYLFGTKKSKEAVLNVINQGLSDKLRSSNQTLSGMEIELLSELKERLYQV